MKFKFLCGKNHKDFVKMTDLVTKEDFDLYNVIKEVLYRKEYMPFVKANYDNKWVEHSYLFNDYIFPFQFWGDVERVCKTLPHLIPESEVVLQDDPRKTGYYSQLKREDYEAWLKSLKIPDDISLDREEYSYQPESAFRGINNHVARISVATSGGKTFLTYLYCKCLIDVIKTPGRILIIVPSKLLCKQLKDDFAHYDEKNDTKILVETIYANSKRIAGAKVVCGTYQSLKNYDVDYFDDFTVCICDELHRAKAYSIRNEIYSKIHNADYFFGMTGTFPPYKSLDYLHIVSMFGEEVVKVTVKQLIDTHIANNVNIKSIQITYFNSDKNNPKDKVSSFDEILDNFPEICPEYFDKHQDECSDEESTREFLEVLKQDPNKRYYAEKTYFQYNLRRTAIIAKLINMFDENSIIFVDTIAYCDELYDFLTRRCPDRHFEIIHGTVKDRDGIIQRMRETPNKFVLIATYGTMSTGVSIKNLTNAYIVDGGKSTIRIKQSMGRLMRMLDDKHTSKIFDFYDNIPSTAFRRQAMERLKIYKNEKLRIEKFDVKILK